MISLFFVAAVCYKQYLRKLKIKRYICNMNSCLSSLFRELDIEFPVPAGISTDFRCLVQLLQTVEPLQSY